MDTFGRKMGVDLPFKMPYRCNIRFHHQYNINMNKVFNKKKLIYDKTMLSGSATSY